MFIDLNCFLRWAVWPMGLLFIKCFQYVPSNLSDFIEFSFLLQSILQINLSKWSYWKILICTELCKKKMHRFAYTTLKFNRRLTMSVENINFWFAKMLLVWKRTLLILNLSNGRVWGCTVNSGEIFNMQVLDMKNSN